MSWFDEAVVRDTLAIGETDEIDAHGILHNKSIWRNGVNDAIRAIIDSAHFYHPTHVGGPVDLIEVTRRGSSWIHKKPNCH